MARQGRRRDSPVPLEPTAHSVPVGWASSQPVQADHLCLVARVHGYRVSVRRADDDRPGGEIMQGAASFPPERPERVEDPDREEEPCGGSRVRPPERAAEADLGSVERPDRDAEAALPDRLAVPETLQERRVERHDRHQDETEARLPRLRIHGVGEVDGDDDRQHDDRDPVHDDRVDEPCRDPVAVGGEAGHHVLRRRLLGKGADRLPARRAEHGACQKLRAAVHAVPLTRFHPNSQPHGGRNPGSRCRSSAKPRSAISLTREGGRRGTLEVTRERR